MGIFSIILIIIWASIIFDGVYGIVKGHFYREQEKAKKHEPKAYRRWVRFSSIFIIICGILNIIWSVLDGFSDAADFKYIIFIALTVVAAIAAMAIAYACIVKPADKK